MTLVHLTGPTWDTELLLFLDWQYSHLFDNRVSQLSVYIRRSGHCTKSDDESYRSACIDRQTPRRDGNFTAYHPRSLDITPLIINAFDSSYEVHQPGRLAARPMRHPVETSDHPRRRQVRDGAGSRQRQMISSTAHAGQWIHWPWKTGHGRRPARSLHAV